MPTVHPVGEEPAKPVRRVVGAAIVRDGRLLAARRVTPPELAGGWEFPGGKVDSGESARAACAREIREELGCEVEVGPRLPGEQPLSRGYVLHVYLARLIRGEPVPLEHDAVRWLAPEDLQRVPWLPAELPFLASVAEILLDGEPLAGGNVGGAVRIGHTVRRPAGPWTSSVHALLDHLAVRGLDGVPAALGLDARGREVVSYLPGQVADPSAGHVPDQQVAEMMWWMRRYHDAVAGFAPPPGAVWRTINRPMLPGQIICHNDVAPYNVVREAGRFVGVIDWDMAGPGHRVEDLAFAAWNGVPLHDDLPIEESLRRLLLLVDAYGWSDPAAVLDAVVPRISSMVEHIRSAQRRGDAGMARLAAAGEAERATQTLNSLRARLPAIHAALSAARR
jgi:8-oxo-dGTP diphosphatase